MLRSETLDSLATALAKAQGEFEAIAKTSENPFFKSKYAALPDVVAAATPILTKHGLSVAQLPGLDEHGGDTLTTILLHSSGQFLGDTMSLHIVKDKTGAVTPQAHGSATTYGRRYAYMAALGLVADEDDDGSAGSKPGGQQSRASTQPPAQIQKWQAQSLGALYAKQPGSFEAAVEKLFGKSDETIPERVLKLTSEQADQLLAAVPK